MSKKIKVLVVGVGNMGASHARSYRTIEGFELVGLVAPTPNRREKLAQELGGIPQFDNFDDALQTVKPNAVSICTYPDTHKEFALKSLKSGAHIFIEKPIAETVEDAKEIIACAEKYQKKVVVGYILRHHPIWKEFISLSHQLGKPLVMRMNLNQQSAKEQWETHKQLLKTVSPIVDCGVHYVDVMCQMTQSEPIEVNAIGARLSDEISEDMYNYGQLQVTFKDGSIGWYEAGWGPMISETAYFVKDVIGPKGSVSIKDPSSNVHTVKSSDINEHTKTNVLVCHYGERDYTGNFAKKDEYIEAHNEPNHQDLCDAEQLYFLEAIKNNTDLTIHLNDAVNSLRIVLAADKSIKTGKKIVLGNK